MKFSIPMVHLPGATLRIAVITDGSVVAMCGDTVIAQFGAASVEQQPLTDMVLDVVLGNGERLTVEIDANDIRVNEYGDEESIYHPSYRDVLNTEAREFVKTISNRNFDNQILEVVRAALAQGRVEGEQLRANANANANAIAAEATVRANAIAAEATARQSEYNSLRAELNGLHDENSSLRYEVEQLRYAASWVRRDQ